MNRYNNQGSAILEDGQVVAHTGTPESAARLASLLNIADVVLRAVRPASPPTTASKLKPVTIVPATPKVTRGPRKCGVCGQYGHDKRNCPVFASVEKANGR